ncbi:hypothetical protein DL764_005933 [Monosporascus ibericus]|uniref:Endonuclease/exonuclease/phosphatase domain-containing protein n=1 Tax=Monosporascus ibericus TaxID=155417 RepID=A0A4Q4T8X5_9PEZI|nr:hypothetical protein DL764_005933 [Monosporascus ibericus]
MILKNLIAPLFIMLAAQAKGGDTASGADPLSLRVISFNIRYAAPGWIHERPWRVRGPRVIAQLAESAANATMAGAVPVIGLQEVLRAQLADIKGGLGPDWAHVGTGRDDGREKGEYCPLLYRRGAVALVDSVQRWLSPTPERPSFWPGAGSRRYVVVGVFEDAATGRRFIAANTHLDNVSAKARTEGVKIALDTIKEVQEKWGPGLGVTLTGDFNSEPGQDAYETVREDGYLVDMYTLVDETRRFGPYATYSGFDPSAEPRVEKRIDFVHVGPDNAWSANRYEVLSNVQEDIYISDHKAVVGDVTLRS